MAELNHLLEKLKSERTEDTCFIIGGGPSKNKYLPDNSLLDNKAVIATNNAYKLFPNALLTHFADISWYHWHKDVIHNLFKNPITTCSKHPKQVPNGIYIFRKETSKYVALPPNGSTLAGNNAGQQAIGIAYILGFKKIVLIGFDMDSKAQESHWHNEHLRRGNKSVYDLTMIPAMQRLSSEIKNTDVQIFNINKDSALKCFPFADLKDFL